MMDRLTERERKLVIALIPSLLIIAIIYYATEPSSTAAPVVDTAAAIELAKQRLDRSRIISAALPSKMELKKSLDANVAGWDKRLISADTPAQAQAQLNQIFRRVARVQGPTVEIRAVDIGTAQPAGTYAEIVVNVVFDCQVEGLLNLLTDLSNQPEFLSWRDVRIQSPDSKQKRINVSMTLVGLASSKLFGKAGPGGRG